MKELKEYILSNNIDIDYDFLHPRLSNDWLFNDFEDEYKKNNYESLNEKELKEKEDIFYSDKFNSGIEYGSENYITYRILLYERLEESLDANWLIEKLSELNHITKIELANYSKYVIRIYIDDEFDIDDENYKKFESLLNFFNYFISRKQKTSNDEKIIFIEGRKPAKINTNDTLPFVYHITTKQAWEKIKKVGLTNKSHKKKSYHSSRIYCLLSSLPVNILKEYAKLLYDSLDNVVFLKINIKQFKEDREKIDKECLSFYGDPQTPAGYGVFTLEYIPSKYIEKIN